MKDMYSVTARVWCKGGIDRKKNSTCNLTTVRVHVSGVSTQRTQISPLTLDVTTNRYFIVQRGTPNIFGKITTIIHSHPPHTHERHNSPTVQYHYSFLSSPWTLFIPFTSVDIIHSFHFLFLSRGPLTESNFFPSYVGLHPTSSFN